MNRRDLTWAVALAVVACGSSSKIVERSAPERPAWVESLPASRDQLYFVATCTDLPNYQEALRCARAEALTDVAAWVGARFTSYVYSASSEVTRSGGATVYYDSEVFLADARRSDTYHEVWEEDWGRSYRVSVLMSYPRSLAEAERARIEETTQRADRLVGAAPASVRALAADGRWGAAMGHVLDTATEVILPGNLNRSQHADRMASLAEELVASLRLSGRAEAGEIEVTALFEDRPAAGVPVECLIGSANQRAVTGADGRAVCGADTSLAVEPGTVRVRPDISSYLAVVPAQAGELAGVLGALLDRSIQVDLGPPLEVAVKLTGTPDCEPSLMELRTRLRAAGVRFDDGAEARLSLQCEVSGGADAGDLHTAWARGVLVLDGLGMEVESILTDVRGLGSTPAAAREEALRRLGLGLSDSALKLLRVLAREREM